MRREEQRGSITVFAALSIMLVMQLLCVLLESARNIEFYKVLQMNTASVLESMFADYASPMWENYRLLGTLAQDGDGEFSLANREAMLRNLSNASIGNTKERFLLEGSSMLSSEMTDVRFESYLLMTDQQGKVYQAAVSSYLKHNLTYEMARSLYNNYESVKGMKEDYGDGKASIEGALDTLENLEEEKERAAGEGTAADLTRPGAMKGTTGERTTKTRKSTADSSDEEEEENVLTTVVETQKTGILSLVLPKSDTLSAAKLDLTQVVSHRTLECGVGGRSLESDWYDDVLMNQYFTSYLTDYTSQVKNRGLNYEVEYLIGGKASDSENLKIAVAEILAIREALNLASLVSSPQKQSQALAMATLLAGATVNPVIIEAVKYGILAAWAYAESILDMRTLLQGGSIAGFKTDADWTSDLEAIPGLLSGWSQAKNCEHGISYKEYLSLLLFFHSGKTLAMRAMDVQEAAIRKMEGYENFRMDCVICEATVNATYEYVPVFLDFVPLLPQKTKAFGLQRSACYSYLEALQ